MASTPGAGVVGIADTQAMNEGTCNCDVPVSVTEWVWYDEEGSPHKFSYPENPHCVRCGSSIHPRKEEKHMESTTLTPEEWEHFCGLNADDRKTWLKEKKPALVDLLILDICEMDCDTIKALVNQVNEPG
jgi:hypothetical protein